jgi:hypothetical protein
MTDGLRRSVSAAFVFLQEIEPGSSTNSSKLLDDISAIAQTPAGIALLSLPRPPASGFRPIPKRAILDAGSGRIAIVSDRLRSWRGRGGYFAIFRGCNTARIKSNVRSSWGNPLP